MKIFRKKIFLLVIFTVLASSVSLIYVAAQQPEITDQQIDKIRSNCTSVKTTLNQLHSSDALLRVNRGQVYELMATKLMNGFNSRVGVNSLNNNNLLSVTEIYKTNLDTFRSDYKIYEEHLASTMVIDCWAQPSRFYNAIIETREKRNQVHTDITKLNQSIDNYSAALDQFEKEFISISSEDVR